MLFWLFLEVWLWSCDSEFWVVFFWFCEWEIIFLGVFVVLCIW